MHLILHPISLSPVPFEPPTVMASRKPTQPSESTVSTAVLTQHALSTSQHFDSDAH